MGDDGVEVLLERLRGELRAGGGVRIVPARTAYAHARAASRGRAAGSGGRNVAERVRRELHPLHASSPEEDGARV